MNQEQTKAFFLSLGWTLEDHAPSTPRWELISSKREGGSTVLQFDSLQRLWAYWKHLTESDLAQGSVLDFLVTEHLKGDAETIASIEAWVIRSRRPEPNGDSPLGRMWERVREIEQVSRLRTKHWRKHTADLYRGEGTQPPTRFVDFIRRLNCAEQNMVPGPPA